MDLIDQYHVPQRLISLVLKESSDKIMLERVLVCLFHLLHNHRENSNKRIQDAIKMKLLPRLLQLLEIDTYPTEIHQNALCLLINISLESVNSLQAVISSNPVSILLKVCTLRKLRFKL